MNSVALFCAVVVGGGFFAPDFWGVSSEQAPAYQMQMVLVEVGANGQQFVTTIPKIVVGNGQSVRLKGEGNEDQSGRGGHWRLIRCDEESCAVERHTTPNLPKSGWPWRVSFGSNSPYYVSMILAFRTSFLERSYRDRLVCRSAERVVYGSVIYNYPHQLVLEKDEKGNPTAWIDYRIRETTSTEAASDLEESSEHPKPGILPFHYEPY